MNDNENKRRYLHAKTPFQQVRASTEKTFLPGMILQ
jgi:hypothetical protein